MRAEAVAGSRSPCYGFLLAVSDEAAPASPIRTTASPSWAPRSTCTRAPARSRATTSTSARTYRMRGLGARPTTTRYPGACQRLRFSFGPIVVKPGQNDVLVEPVRSRSRCATATSPASSPTSCAPTARSRRSSRSTCTTAPGSRCRDYGSGPFFAAGEEKTIAPFPTRLRHAGQGDRPVAAALHGPLGGPAADGGLHHLRRRLRPRGQGARTLGIKPAYPVWLDVRPSGYPVFNVQRDYGGKDGDVHLAEARSAPTFDPWGKTIAGQGEPGNGTARTWALPDARRAARRDRELQGRHADRHRRPPAPGRAPERDRPRPRRQGETHLHRRGRYWDAERPEDRAAHRPRGTSRCGSPACRTGACSVEPGDMLRSNATYDTTIQSTYENMGIAVALLAPDDRERQADRARRRPVHGARRHARTSCKLGRPAGASARRSATRAIVTHGHLPENDNYGGPPATVERDRRARRPATSAIADFLYAPGDLSMIAMTGVPTVKLGDDARLHQPRRARRSTTRSPRARFPCPGPTGTAFPLANGATSSGAAARLRLRRARLRHPGDRPGQADARLGPAGHREDGFQAGRDRHLLLPHPPVHARRVRGDRVINWKRNGPSLTSGPTRLLVDGPVRGPAGRRPAVLERRVLPAAADRGAARDHGARRAARPSAGAASSA